MSHVDGMDLGERRRANGRVRRNNSLERYDIVAWFDRGHALADGLDYACPFVS